MNQKSDSNSDPVRTASQEQFLLPHARWLREQIGEAWLDPFTSLETKAVCSSLAGALDRFAERLQADGVVAAVAAQPMEPMEPRILEVPELKARPLLVDAAHKWDEVLEAVKVLQQDKTRLVLSEPEAGVDVPGSGSSGKNGSMGIG